MFRCFLVVDFDGNSQIITIDCKPKVMNQPTIATRQAEFRVLKFYRKLLVIHHLRVSTLARHIHITNG